MADILVLEPNEESMEKCKTMLGNLEKEYNILFTSYPEKVMELLSEREIAVIITEDDMGILNAVELSEMLKLMHPEIVQLLMTEVRDVSKVLTTLNHADIYEIILKPFRFSEDIEEPIRRALQEHEQRVTAAGASGQNKTQIYQYDMEYDRLKQARFKRSRDYSSLYSALGGIVEGNVDSWVETGRLSKEERLRIKEFIQQIVKEYVDVFIFGNQNFQEYCDKRLRGSGKDLGACEIQVENHCVSEISNRKDKELYYGIFLMEHLCKHTLLNYNSKVLVDSSDPFYVIRFFCDPKAGGLQGQVVYKEDVEILRKLMHEITECCLKKLYTKSMKGYKGNPYVAAITVLME